MKKKYEYIFLLLIALFVCNSCSTNSKQSISDMLTQWIGKEIVFPDKLIFTIHEDTVEYNLNKYDYKIFTYIDSSDCVYCNLKLLGWDKLMSELESINDLYVGLIYVVRSNDITNIKEHVSYNNFHRPIIYDTDGTFDYLNHFSSEYHFQTFLLDSSNKIVAIGNPLINDRVQEVFLEEMGVFDNIYQRPKVTQHPIKPDRYVQTMGVIHQSKQEKCNFYIENTLNVPVSIRSITTSCNCVSAKSNRDTIYAGEFATISVIHNLGKDEYEDEFENEIGIFFNEVENPLILKIKGYNSITD